MWLVSNEPHFLQCEVGQFCYIAKNSYERYITANETNEEVLKNRPNSTHLKFYPSNSVIGVEDSMYFFAIEVNKNTILMKFLRKSNNVELQNEAERMMHKNLLPLILIAM